MHTGNLFHDSEPPPSGERFQTLLREGGVHIERIVSAADRPRTDYRQPHAEWVCLLRGEATLELDGVPRDLRPGDWCSLPADLPHAVTRTAPGTLWLAVHFPPPPA